MQCVWLHEDGGLGPAKAVSLEGRRSDHGVHEMLTRLALGGRRLGGRGGSSDEGGSNSVDRRNNVLTLITSDVELH